MEPRRPRQRRTLSERIALADAAIGRLAKKLDAARARRASLFTEARKHAEATLAEVRRAEQVTEGGNK